MKVFQIDNLKPGMTLTCDLYSTKGKLLGSGNKITAKILSALKRRKEPEVFGLEEEEELGMDKSTRMLKDEVHDVLKKKQVQKTGRIRSGIYKYGDCIVWVLYQIEGEVESLIKQLEEVQKAPVDTAFVWSNEGLAPITEPSVRFIAANVYQKQQADRLNQKLKREQKKKEREQRRLEEIKDKNREILVQWYHRSTNQLETLLFPEAAESSEETRSYCSPDDPIIEKTISLIIGDNLLLDNFLHKLSDSAYVFDHASHTSLLAIELAQMMDYSDQDTLNLGLAALLQDLGMFAFPRLLEKRTPLAPSELKTIHNHPNRSAQTLAQSPLLPKPVCTTVLQAHERLDGSGYPNRKTTADILPSAQILSVLNVFVGMISQRPYRPPHTPYEAAHLLTHDTRSHQFAPHIVENLFKYLDL